jgi:membrane protease YdiL (CAAX protease family)
LITNQPDTSQSLPSNLTSYDPHFSPVLTILSALVLCAAILVFGWLSISLPRLDRVLSPERALALMVSRTMDLEDAFGRASAWERQFYELTMGSRANELFQAIAWYHELADYSSDPLIELRLAILESEAGLLDQVRKTTTQWESLAEPFPSFARLMRAGYLEPRLDHDDEMALQAELAELLPVGWFYDRLAINLAARADDRVLLSSASEASARRTNRLLWRTRTIVVIELTLILIGVLALLMILQGERGSRNLPRVGMAPLPPRWPARVGAVVMIRGGAIGALLALSLLFIEMDNLLLRVVALPVTNLPLLLLAHRHLLKPARLGFRQGLGLWPSPGGWSQLGLAVPVVVTVGLVGEWGISLAAEWLDLSSHWTEWFDGDLVWGTPPVLAVSLLEYVIFAPVFEEVVFRGLFFGTLRRKLGWGTSALISGATFAIAHGYGVVGFASVLWSGLVWSWSYEKTGSLLPGLVAHALNNFMVCLTIIWLLRF